MAMKEALENYKKQVEAFLTNESCFSTQAKDSLMKEYEEDFPGFLDMKLSVSATCAGMARHLL